MQPKKGRWWSSSSPAAGSRPADRRGWQACRVANAWFRLQHPDYDELFRMMEYIGSTLKVRAVSD
jgi:hypothetical protein